MTSSNLQGEMVFHAEAFPTVF